MHAKDELGCGDGVKQAGQNSAISLSALPSNHAEPQASSALALRERSLHGTCHSAICVVKVAEASCQAAAMKGGLWKQDAHQMWPAESSEIGPLQQLHYSPWLTAAAPPTAGLLAVWVTRGRGCRISGVMYFILVNCFVLFELIERLALKAGSSPPLPVPLPSASQTQACLSQRVLIVLLTWA